MIELRITGETPVELYTNTVKMLALILRAPGSAPASNAAPVDLAAPAAETTVVEPLQNPTVAEAEIDPPIAAAKKRGRPAKAPAVEPEQIELEAAIAEAPAKKTPPEPKPVTPLPEGGDKVDDLFVEKAAEPAKPATLEESRAAMRSVFDNYEARARKAGEKNEDKIMAGKIAYGKKLLYGFDVPKVVDLKPEQYAAFIAAAAPYIDGSQPEVAE